MSNLHALAQTLEKKKAELAKLEAEIAEARQNELTALPKQVGFETVDDLIKALAAFASPRLKGLLGGTGRRGRRAASKSAGSSHSAGAVVTAEGKRKRTKITDEIKAQVKKLTEDGKTGAEIAAATGVSLPSVANIKRELGLT